jgi:hypothetical protein
MAHGGQVRGPEGGMNGEVASGRGQTPRCVPRGSLSVCSRYAGPTGMQFQPRSITFRDPFGLSCVKCCVRGFRYGQRHQTMSVTRAAFHRSGRRVRATVAPPTTLNRACYWWRNLLKLRTLGPAAWASATGQKLPSEQPLHTRADASSTLAQVAPGRRRIPFFST